MSSILLLPLLKVAANVQTDEDLMISLAFSLSDGVTPINLTGIVFEATIGSLADIATNVSGGVGSMMVSGGGNNVLTIFVAAAAKAAWPPGAYPLKLVASDGTFTRDVFGLSALVVGPPANVVITPIVLSPTSVASAIPPAVAEAIQPAGIAAQLAALSGTELQALASALIASLPKQSDGNAPVAAGAPFINSDGIVGLAQ